MNWKRASIGAVFAVPVVVVLGWGLTRDPGAIVSPLPGRVAPTFSLGVFAPGQGVLARPVGDTLAMAGMRGRVVVLNFWASWCLSCRDEHRELSEAARRFTGKPVQFIGVLYNDVATLGTAWIAEMGGQAYPGVLDPGARTAIDYGLYGVPETFVIDASGRVAHKFTGPITAAQLGATIDSLLAAPAAPAPGADRPR